MSWRSPGILMVSGILIASALWFALASTDEHSERAEALAAHSPIQILGDADFTTENGVVSGDGSQSNPYIISDWEFAGFDRAIEISDTNAYFEIRNASFVVCNYGVQMTRVSNGTVRDITTDEFSQVLLDECTGCSILNNTLLGGVYAFNNTQNLSIDGNEARFIQIAESSDVTIIGNSADALLIQSTDNCVVEGNSFTGEGIRIEGSESNDFVTHSLSNNTVRGEPIDFRRNTSHEVIDSISAGQLIAVGCDNLTVTGSSFSLSIAPVQVGFCRDVTIIDTTISPGSGWGQGVSATGAQNLSIVNCTFLGSGIFGVFLSNCSQTLISGGNVSGWTNAMMVRDESSHVLIQNNSMASLGNNGLMLENSDNITVRGNSISAAYIGVSASTCENLTLEDNDIMADFHYCISAYQVDYSAFLNNTLGGSASRLFGGLAVYQSHSTVVIGNVITKPSEPSGRIDRGIVLTDCDLAWVQLNDIRAGIIDGVLLEGCSNSTVTANDFSGFNGRQLIWTGLRIESSEFIEATDNLVARCMDGIQVLSSENVSVERNLVWSDYYTGIYSLESSNVSILSNHVRDCAAALWIDLTTDSQTIENDFEQNMYGVWLFSNDRIDIHHNDFVNNTVQAYDGLGMDTIWDDGYPSGGNYWSNYSGPDSLSGPLQSDPGADGIRDISWDFDDGKSDRYPLMARWGNLPPSAAFSIDPPSGNLTTEFEANASSTVDDGDPLDQLMFRWDWESDGEWDTGWSNQSVARHFYTAFGTYNVTMLVVDTGMRFNVSVETVTVGGNQPPVASFEVDPLLGDLTTEFSFNASGSNDPDESIDTLWFRWDWEGDGTWDTVWSHSPLQNHTYTSPGTYNATLEVMDSLGLTDTATIEVIVLDTPIPEFGSPSVLIISMMVLLMILGGFRPRRRR